jgi:hypothetical protein
MLMEFLRNLAMGAIADEVRKTPQGKDIQEEYVAPVANRLMDAIIPPAAASGADAIDTSRQDQLDALIAQENMMRDSSPAQPVLPDTSRAPVVQQAYPSSLSDIQMPPTAEERAMQTQDFVRQNTVPEKLSEQQAAAKVTETAKRLQAEAPDAKEDEVIAAAVVEEGKNDPSFFDAMGDKIGDFFGSEKNMLSLALAFNSLRYQPDQGLAAVLGKRLETLDTRSKSNKTAAWLRSKGTPNAIKAAEYLEAGGALKDALKIYQGGTDSDWGLQPISIQDEQGNVKLLQLSKDGTTRELPMPEGYKPTPNVQKVDVGTGTALVDKNGTIIRVIEKDISGAKAAELAGKYTQEQINAAPQNYENSKNQLGVVNKLLDHPAFNNLFGAVEGRLPSMRQKTLDAESILSQIRGTAFLAAFQSLKGGGQISNVEGIKAEQAIARLQTTQSEKAAREALNELASILRSGMAKAQAMAPEKIGATQTPVQSEQQSAAKPQITPEQAAAELARRRGQ